MFARWHIEILRRALMNRIPCAEQLRRLKRDIGGYQPNQSNIGSTFFDLKRLYVLMKAQGACFRGTVLEIGSGWFPIAGIIARLSGADNVILTDMTRFMDEGTFIISKKIILQRLDESAADFDFDSNLARRKLEANTPDELNLVYIAPFDTAALPDESLDLVISRACLEHIALPELELLMARLRPKLKQGAFMAHAIDNSDHFSHSDAGISRVNFLTWSESKHRFLWNLGKDGENRMRHHQYADLFRKTGYIVVGEESLIDTRTAAEVPQLPLSEPYSSMTIDQIAAVSSWFVLTANPTWIRAPIKVP